MSLQWPGARPSPGTLSFVEGGQGGVQCRGQRVAPRRMKLAGLLDFGECGVEGLLGAGQVGLQRLDRPLLGGQSACSSSRRSMTSSRESSRLV